MRTPAIVLLAAAALACQSPAPTPPAVPAPAAKPASAPKPPAAPERRDADQVAPAQQEAIAALRARFERRETTVGGALADPALMDLHDKTPFRQLLARHADAKPLTLTTKDEPGTPFVVQARVVAEGGKPVAGALVYAYHADARGFYGYERAHVGGNAGDFGHARLFGYVRTDVEGRFELHTIRPASYPDTDLPQHVHLEITAEGFAPTVTEVLFADDPKLTPEQRASAQEHGVPVVDVERGVDRVERCAPVFTLPRAR
jgi:protocatechuate 3,4-dioxygenase beta subunit